MIQAATEHPILTVSQLSQAIKYCLEKAFPLVWLQGEISNFTQHSSGHLYFSLKDANAQISAAMFRIDAASLAMLPKNGMQVLVKGEVNVYPIRGNYQIIVRELRLVGTGELLLKLEQLKIKLHKLGWFSKERKKPIPKIPQRIGVVTSPTGAAIQDMLNILTRRFSGFHLILNPVKVQGEGAAQEIAQAIEQFNAHRLVDVMIVGRGGGSIEDLWAFNEEIVATAIFNSHIPIISAVGHETDHCIADYVADLRAPTPSAAAELVIAEKAQQLEQLALIKRRLQQALFQQVRQDRHRLNGLLRHPLLQTPYGILGPWIQHLDQLRQECDKGIKQRLATQRLLLEAQKQRLLALQPANQLRQFRETLRNFEKELLLAAQRLFAKCRNSLTNLKQNIERSWGLQQAGRRALFHSFQSNNQIFQLLEKTIANKRERFNLIQESLQAVNPNNLLTKGYCILFSEKRHSTITSIQQVEIQEQVRIKLADGELKGTIEDVISP